MPSGKTLLAVVAFLNGVTCQVSYNTYRTTYVNSGIGEAIGGAQYSAPAYGDNIVPVHTISSPISKGVGTLPVQTVSAPAVTSFHTATAPALTSYHVAAAPQTVVAVAPTIQYASAFPVTVAAAPAVHSVYPFHHVQPVTYYTQPVVTYQHQQPIRYVVQQRVIASQPQPEVIRLVRPPVQTVIQKVQVKGPTQVFDVVKPGPPGKKIVQVMKEDDLPPKVEFVNGDGPTHMITIATDDQGAQGAVQDLQGSERILKQLGPSDEGKEGLIKLVLRRRVRRRKISNGQTNAQKAKN